MNVIRDFIVNNWLQILTGFVLPLVTGFVTKLKAAPWVHAIANFVLSLLTGFTEAVVANGGAIDADQIAAYILSIWGLSHLSYKMVWKPIGGGVADPVRLATPDTGLGQPVSSPLGRSA